MTIYKPNNANKKQEKVLVNPPEVVISDKVPLTGDGLLRRRVVTNTEVLRRRRAIRCAFIMVGMVMLFTVAIVGTLVYIRYRNNRVWFSGSCMVKTYDQQFDEEITIGKNYEKLEVPPVFNFRRSRVVHDFERNMTAIVDEDHGRCYLMKMNRTTLRPPSDFIDLLKKVKAGYYLPKPEMVHDDYRVEMPRIEDKLQFGFIINEECQYFDTFKLVKASDGGRVKRSVACTMSGDSFSLGYAGSDRMASITIQGCLN